MKKTTFNPGKKIMASASMLLVSTMMLSSATYAWFSMNKDVTVTGMAVDVKSDATFLLVKQGTATVDAIRSAKKTRDTAVTSSAVLYPTAHDTVTAASTGITAIEAADASDSNAKDIWYYKYSNDPETSNVDVTAATYVPTADFANYVLVNEFSLTVAEGSNELSNLHVKSCKITPATGGDQAVKVLVAGANGCEEFDGTGGNGTNINLQTANVTGTGVSTVKVYVYWDGNDSDVYTNGIADLKNTEVEVELTGDIVPAT